MYRYLERGAVISKILAVITVSYLQNDFKHTFAFAWTSALKLKLKLISLKIKKTGTFEWKIRKVVKGPGSVHVFRGLHVRNPCNA